MGHVEGAGERGTSEILERIIQITIFIRWKSLEKIDCHQQITVESAARAYAFVSV